MRWHSCFSVGATKYFSNFFGYAELFILEIWGRCEARLKVNFIKQIQVEVGVRSMKLSYKHADSEFLSTQICEIYKRKMTHIINSIPTIFIIFIITSFCFLILHTIVNLEWYGNLYLSGWRLLVSSQQRRDFILFHQTFATNIILVLLYEVADTGKSCWGSRFHSPKAGVRIYWSSSFHGALVYPFS